ncbi:MAG TPA: DNA recombination protein RmuC [Acidimicrobiia bacterium]|nr:DNA recombination protein RmuC [Acidimicrobiia bacterium]
MVAIGLVAGCVIGALAVFAWARTRLAVEQAERARVQHELDLERATAAANERTAQELRQMLPATIKAAAAEALLGTNEQFLTLAGEKLAPIDQRLRSFEEHLRELERARQGAYGSINEQVRGLVEAQETLRGETAKLAGALNRPGVRGRWGEMQLRRIVELAGMQAHCDFTEQSTIAGEDGRLRPDLVVHLPGGASVVVDSKVPLDAYLAATEALDEGVRKQRLTEHAKAVRDHMVSLGRKSYWEQFPVSPDFVVMFVGVEAAYAAAVEVRPELFEEGCGQRVILATPSTLMALLRVVGFGWRQETMAENAKEVSELARELHKRVATMAGHWAALGKRLDGAVDVYNKTVGALETRVLPQARKFEGLGADSKDDIASLTTIDARTRPLTSPEMLEVLDRVVELDERSVANG